ncbi:hypothetical protein BHE74_00032368 [Ensete ventricosum]|nr:hypothetical protein GW17_00052123 [Ensete ventricosum]RWW60631.1 hypothetical protein BHE74_00032368 [Ensete ventricosum]
MEYERGALLPCLAFDMYASPSEVLIERAMKSLVLVISMMDSRMDWLRKNIEELKVGPGLRQSQWLSNVSLTSRLKPSS